MFYAKKEHVIAMYAKKLLLLIRKLNSYCLYVNFRLQKDCTLNILTRQGFKTCIFYSPLYLIVQSIKKCNGVNL